MRVRISMLALMMLAGLPSTATIVGYADRDLRQQWELAAYVSHARVTGIRHRGKVEKNTPLGPCGVLYEIEILEQFKGELPRKALFITHRVLFPERPLRVGEQVLVMLRDLKTRQHLEKSIQDELDSAYAEVSKCVPMQSTLYLVMSEENIFALVSKADALGRQSLWLEDRWRSMPPDMRPKLEGKCEQLEFGGCVVTEYPSFAWLSVRNLLRSWKTNQFWCPTMRCTRRAKTHARERKR